MASWSWEAVGPLCAEDPNWLMTKIAGPVLDTTNQCWMLTDWSVCPEMAMRMVTGVDDKICSIHSE